MDSTRRFFLARLCVAALTAPNVVAARGIVEAQQTEKMVRIGFLWGTSPSAAPEFTDGAREGLREHGYVEGRNLVIEYRSADGRFERLPHLAAELVRLNVDVIMAPSLPAARAAKQATSTIPIVIVGIGEAVETGLVASLARPGGNITGTTLMFSQLVGKRLEVLKALVPALTRLAVLRNPDNPGTAQAWQQLEVAAKALSVRTRPFDVGSADDFSRAFASIGKERFEALFPLGDPLFNQERIRIIEFATRSRLPAVYDHKRYVTDGGLISYGPNLREVFRRSAAYVDKILKGAKPADLSIEQPTAFELVVNRKAASNLALAIPPAILLRADQVIE
jgi:putative tryptophan/tyrosine transport system substrate-binding protein